MKKAALIIFFGIILILDINASISDYTFSCWQNGWRKNNNDSSADLFGIETSHYGFILDMDDFVDVQFGTLSNSVGYEQALEHKDEKLKQIPPAKFLLEIDVDGVSYRSVTCEAGVSKDVRRLSNARMWESGRFVQHFDFLGLDFRNEKGEKLACDATLDLIAWPNTLTFNLRVKPSFDIKNASLRLSLSSKAGNWKQVENVEGLWKKDDTKSIILTCDVSAVKSNAAAEISVIANNGLKVPVAFDKSKNCYAAYVKKLQRKWKTGYTDIREYDDFKITINSSDQNNPIPFLLDMRPPANITGLCPILCDESGQPTGIPVQLSKNWHHKEMGSYLMAYTMLPAKKETTYILRLVYGFYGSLPSASHAQLSLVGYLLGHKFASNGRWDQLAIGCWGETICFDMDMSCTDIAITDVRMLMARNGVNGKMWSWTEAGWGGDWLNIKDKNQDKYFLNSVKTAYLSQGPCLTDVRHSGYYGMNKEIDFDIQIQTLRTDDYSRTFQRFNYEFTHNVSAQKIYLFQLGRTGQYLTPKLAFGNIDGLIQQLDVPDNLDENQIFLKNTVLTGPGPWWVALPGARPQSERDRGTGYKALIIRNYQVVSGGKTYTQPTIRAPIFKSKPNNIDIELLPPGGIMDFKKGDSIQLDLELITLHRCADDYYGPNEAYRKHLMDNPNSWKTTYREAKGNNLNVVVTGGKVLHNYPVIIQTLSPEVYVTIEGGIGAVPIRFEGLKSTDGYDLYQLIEGNRVKMDQSVHGNDFWQTDFDALTDSYKISYNISLDGISQSQWILSSRKRPAGSPFGFR